MRQELFSSFFPHFEKTLVDAGGIAWPDEIKRLHLDGALIFELRRLTITISPAAVSYGAYANEFLRMSNLDRVTMRYTPEELWPAKRPTTR